MQKMTYTTIHGTRKRIFTRGDKNVKTRNKTKCPYLQDPLDACYCNHMDSQSIEKMIYYCNLNFEACEIFKNRIQDALNNGRGK